MNSTSLPNFSLLRSLLTGFTFLFCQFSQAQNQPSADLDAYIRRVLNAFDVPGVSVAIVKDGKVVSAQGYGVRKLGEATPVDAKTLFGIASNTKAFTATALGILVEERKIAWDAPVIDYLPWFRLADPYVTSELTIRDLLVHRSGLGLGAGDLLWWPPSNYDRREIARRLQFIPLKTSFRSAYAYDNVLYLVAGEVIEAVSGQRWEEFVETRILRRIGMTASNVRHSAATVPNANVATTHAEIAGKVRPIAPFDSDNTNPAGGINANAEEMAKWMIVQLDSGRLADGSRLFSRNTTRELWNIVTPEPLPNYPPELAPLRMNFRGYALGFEVRDYRGQKLVTHTGGLPGYVSKMALLPALKMGVAILTNQESSDAFESIAYKVLDDYLNAPPHDWLAAYQTLKARSDAYGPVAGKEAQTALNPAAIPSLPLSTYAGTYTDAWYGDIVVTNTNGKLGISFTHTPALVGDLEPYQHDTFVARWHDRELRADAFVTFALTPDGRIREARMQAVSRATDFSFDFQDLVLKPKK